MIRASFLLIEDNNPDLIVSFAVERGEPGDVDSLILLRTMMYEGFLPPEERGVNLSWDGDAQESEEVELLTVFDWNGHDVLLKTTRREFSIDVSRAAAADLKEMERVLKKMNVDGCFRMRRKKA